MSDDTTWKPPATGASDPPDAAPGAADVADDVAATAPPSPWSAEAATTVEPDDLPRLPDRPPAPAVATVDTAADSFEPSVEPSVAPSAAALAESPLTSVASGRSSRRRATRPLAIATVAIVAVGLGGIFAVRGLTGESAGGAASPDELGQQLLDAVEGEDVLGILDTLLPGERDTLGGPFVETMAELQRLEVLASDFDLSRLAGLDVQLADRSVSIDDTNVDDIVNVELAADVTVSIDGATIPIGDLIVDNLPEETLTELRGSKITETDTLEFDLTAVRDDDRWYFSAWYTVAELARAEIGEPEIPVEGIGAVGADSPEAALDRFVERFEALDVRGLIQSLDPYEASALQRYAPLFLADAEASIAEVPATVEVTEHEFRIEGEGGSRTAFVESFTAVVAEEDATTITLTYDGSCLRVRWEFPEMGPDESEFCADQTDLAEEMAGVELGSEVEALVDVVSEAFADMEAAGVELRERDGGWYLSPVSTVSEAWLKVLRALDREELDAIIAAVPPAFEAFTGELFGDLDDLDDLTGVGWSEDLPGDATGEGFDDGFDDGSTFTTTPIDDATRDTVPAPTAPTVTTAPTVATDPTAPTVATVPADPTEECYLASEVAEATACFEGLLASGAIDARAVPIVLRYPECGLAEVTWSSELYGLADAEFAAVLTTAKPCFDDLVAAGAIDEWDVPFDVANVDCFEGRNWYVEFDDEAYNTRVAECIGL